MSSPEHPDAHERAVAYTGEDGISAHDGGLEALPLPSDFVYLDNAATTKPRLEVAAAMMEAFEADYGNASALHRLGQRAKVILEESRATVAEALGVEPDEIFFTSGGTESNNLAIRGACHARAQNKGQIITSSLEHPSVTRSVRGLKREGWDVEYVEAVDGAFDLDALRGYLANKTTLITAMTVQNELGYRFPIEEVARLRNELAPSAIVHSDAVQAFGKIPVRPGEWGVDLMTLSGHKIGGPKGIGALYVRRGTPMFTTAFGGGQERGLRSGTEAVFLIAGFAEAARLAAASLDSEQQRVRGLWNHLGQRLQAEIPGVIVNSREDGSPYIFNFAVPGMKNQEALDYLSDHGVYVSKAAACESNHTTVPAGTWREKHPLSLQAAGIPLNIGKNTLRISFGYASRESDVDRFVDCLKDYLVYTEAVRAERSAAYAAKRAAKASATEE